MYRDGSHLLDEHDGAVCAIQIAEDLIDSCVRAVTSMSVYDTPERWEKARTLQDHAVEVWQQLDNARTVLAARGENTIAYDELRARIIPVLGITYQHGVHGLDADSLDDARRGVADLKLAMPGADWAAIAARTRRLVATPLFQRGQRIGLAAIVLFVGTAIAGWAYSIIPTKRIHPSIVLRAELAEIVSDRRDRIGALQSELAVTCAQQQVYECDDLGLVGVTCEQARVHELMKLLVMDGRFDDATDLGAKYTARCGADPVVQKWANAPRPRR